MSGAKEPEALIADRYALDPQAPLALAGGLVACAVTDRHDPQRRLIAVRARPDLVPRPHMLPLIDAFPIPHAMMPVAEGPAPDRLPNPVGPRAWFTVCPAPPGPALAPLTEPWRESEILATVLRPAVAALSAMHTHRLTHRAIHPGNLFRAGPGRPVTLGPCWAAPPAALQPAAFEPPYSALCPPAARGAGTIADDIYALGVTLAVLALGRIPDHWADEEALLRRKISHGSAAALLGERRLPGLLAELVPGMLAEDPAHRPPLATLAEPDNARGRRIAGRATPRTADTLTVGAQRAGSARELALALARDPDQAAALVRSGAVERWLRRSLADVQVAAALQDALGEHALPAHDTDSGSRAAAIAVMRTIAVLDPLAPLCWRGINLWPDALGPLIVAEPGLAPMLEELVASEAAAQWRHGRADRSDILLLRQDARDWRSRLGGRNSPGGLARLAYLLNPLLPCRSPLVEGQAAARLPDLLRALDAACAEPGRTLPADAHVLAFIAEHAEERQASAALLTSAGLRTPEEQLGLIRLFAQLQQALRLPPLPHLARRLIDSGAPALDRWRNRRTRATLLARLQEAAATGQLALLQAMIDDRASLQADAAGARAARSRLAGLQKAIESMAARTAQRAREALELGQEIATALALAGVAFAAFRLALL
jgi:eukaryotic-like serine/threonine-protein kinase